MAAPGRRLSHVLDRLWTRTGDADLSTLPLALISAWTHVAEQNKALVHRTTSPRKPPLAPVKPPLGPRYPPKSSTEKSPPRPLRQPSPALARCQRLRTATTFFLSAANVNDHRAATHQPLVAARKVLWTSKTLPDDHLSRYGHCQRPRCLLCSSSPTPHCLPGMSVPPPGALLLVPYSTLPSRDASPPPRSPAPFPWCPLRRRGPAPNVNDYRAAAAPGCRTIVESRARQTD